MSLVSSNIVAVVDMCCWNLIMRILLDILCLLDWVEVKLSSYRASIVIAVFLSNGLMAFFLSIFSLELT